MPSVGPITTTAAPEIISNEMLIKSREAGFVLSGKVFIDGDKTLAFEIPSSGRAVLVSHSLKGTYMNPEGHDPVFYFSRGEVQGDIPLDGIDSAISSEYRLLRIMPSLVIRQEGREAMHHLTLRGYGASDAGNWSCASSLATGEVNTRSIFSTLNRETGLLIDGKVAIFEPAAPDSINSTIISDANALKTALARKCPELSQAFRRQAGFVNIATQLNLPKNPHTVTFHGGIIGGEVQCVAFDNPEQRTLTLIFPYVADVPANAALTPFNGQGYSEPAILANSSILKKGSGLTLIPGLQELVMGR